MHLKVLITLFQKMIWFIKGLSHCSWDINHWNIKKRCRLSRNLTKFFNFKPYISKTLSHSITKNAIFWKCVTRPFRCIYVNDFNWLRFLAVFSTELQKMHFFDNLRLLIRTSHHTFLESSPPEVTKNVHYVLSTSRIQIPIFLGSSSRTSMQVSPICSYIEKMYVNKNQFHWLLTNDKCKPK